MDLTKEERARALKQGLAKLPADFVARVCGYCEGAGAYRQTYTVGCGGGSCTMLGTCDRCDGGGLMLGNEPAPASVVNQVLLAGGAFDG